MCLRLNINGQGVMVCGVREKTLGPCRVCGSRPATRLCDFEISPGKTCDARMCDHCALRVGDDTDFCPKHSDSTDQLALPGMAPAPAPSGPEAHARRVLCGQAGHWPLTNVQRELLRILLFHLGAKQAIPLRVVMGKLGNVLNMAPNEREIKDAARGLVVDFKVRIGASRTEPSGYYLITNSEEARDTARPYIEEVKKLLQRVRVILDPHDLAEMAGQLSLTEQPKEAQ
jgi:hypothetical protein